MKRYHNPARNEWSHLCARPVMSWDEIENQVGPVMQRVKNDGDEAIRHFTRKWDRAQVDQMMVTEKEFHAAESQLSADLKSAIQVAAANIRKFHLLQKDPERIQETSSGVLCWQKSKPIQKIGLYVPGGSAPLFSTVLMLAIPAKIAGCGLIQLCTPPAEDGNIHPAILYSATVSGVDKVIKAGGAQAIAGLTFGTNSIVAVDKIFGPGNQYVTAAKQLSVKHGVAIDMPAGPSEVLVMIDDTANPEFVAADLLAQAEHGPDSQVVLVSNQDKLLVPVLDELKLQLSDLPRKELAAVSIQNSRALSFSHTQDMIDFVNAYAPEHLIIAMTEADQIADMIINAGSIFIGHFTPESVGDYASGTNHTLPTNGYARQYSGVNLDAFVKKITYQKLTEAGIQNIGPYVIEMAKAEHLEGHARSVELRLKNLTHPND